MILADLVAYAQARYGIAEVHKWARFPGFSVLTDPATGKWAALLMRRRENGIGPVIETADLKCGRDHLPPEAYTWLYPPFRMKGNEWVGVVFNDETDADTVYKLFDRSLKDPQKTGFTVHDTEGGGYTIVLDQQPKKEIHVRAESAAKEHAQTYTETALNFHSESNGNDISAIPKKIRDMLRLYRYGNGSFQEKRENFVRQAKFMEEYEDDHPWHGEFKRYFPVYHDLTPAQLRGYFTWRTNIRKGIYEETCTSFAYIYLYELLNGVGASSPHDSLEKLNAFDLDFPGNGNDRVTMHRTIRKWMVEFGVIRGVDPAVVRTYMDPVVLKRDHALDLLAHPYDHKEKEIFDALNVWYKNDLKRSSVMKKDPEEGMHLFVLLWKNTMEAYRKEGNDLFGLCFGKMISKAWHPLQNAVYLKVPVKPGTQYALDEMRTYTFREGGWEERTCDTFEADAALFHTLLHTADRLFRRYLKSGSYLKESLKETELEPYTNAVIEMDRNEKIEASRPKIEIHFSSLDRIRSDAAATEESLMTESELGEETEEAEASSVRKSEETVRAGEQVSIQTDLDLDPLALEVLKKLLQGEEVKRFIRDHHAMAEVIADGINEAFYEEIGDSVVESDGDTVTLVEDYIEDVKNILEGDKQ